ncbi:MAG: PrsW family intramembrane metalloprotease [Lachnospiraceae bacterium]|nr:PrsW family intramembrane metalloprotease [Lachnospiraceae bacterium]
MFFFLTPAFGIIAIHVLAAVLPAAFLLRYIYRLDRAEPEPVSILWGCILSGVFAVVASVVLEMVGQVILDAVVESTEPFYLILLTFLVVGAVEEGTKLYFLKRRTWDDPNFNYRFDGIVYAAFVSLGFAAVENIQYVFSYGLSVAFTRAIFSIPGHFAFSVLMGIHYGRAKQCEYRMDEGGKTLNMVLAFVVPTLFHGFYDACAMSESDFSSWIFLAFVVITYVWIFLRVKKEADHDVALYYDQLD